MWPRRRVIGGKAACRWSRPFGRSPPRSGWSLWVFRTPGNAVLPWVEAGVAGYVSRDCSLAELAGVVRSIAEGSSPCSPAVSAALFKRVAYLADGLPQNTAIARLTAREIEVAALLSRGMSNREIARVLTISLPTVKTTSTMCWGN